MVESPGDSKKTRDWLDIVEALSGIVSSVVLVIVGLMINSSIQRAQLSASESIATAQLEFQKVKAADDKRTQEGSLTAQLVKHLASLNPTERELAIVALRESVARKVYDSTAEVLARADANKEVRKAAILKLGESPEASVRSTLSQISQDASRASDERGLAQGAFFASERQTRVERLLDRIAILPDAKAIALATNLPVQDSENAAILQKADPMSQRTRTATVAKRVLSMLVPYAKKSASDLDTWEAALLVAEKP